MITVINRAAGMSYCLLAIAAAAASTLLNSVSAQVISLGGNGYAATGVVPTASVLPTGSAFLAYEPNVPGAKNTSGYNTQIGLGLYSGLELVGRLATNELRCNLFVLGACQSDTIRDFSASVKWQLQSSWLTQNNTKVALGVTDVGGAASFFKSYYAVASKEWGDTELSLGRARGLGERALLAGTFASAAYRPARWSELSVQKVGESAWTSAAFRAEIPGSQASAYLTLNRRLTDEPLTQRSWSSVGVSFPMDGVGRTQNTKPAQTQQRGLQNAKVQPIGVDEIEAALLRKGFYNPQLSLIGGTLQVDVENTSYQWNSLDAAGVALGVVAGIDGKGKTQKFELTVRARGIAQLKIKGDAACVRAWLEEGAVCDSLSIQSLLQRQQESANPGYLSMGNEADGAGKWAFRPEIIVSPTIVSAIGTEWGAYDFDLGASVNLVLPAWQGATLETNRVLPLGVGTRGFEAGGVFFGARVRPVTSRTLLHQIVSFPQVNTQLRLSAGNAYTDWQGSQLESNSQSDNGRHRVSYASGSFKNTLSSTAPEKRYELVTYRYAHDDQMSTSTELTQGKFWGGDMGWSVGQRFWHADTAFSVYLRRTRMGEGSPLVSFAGLQVSLPFTPRVNKGMESASLRGSSQWSYALESRVFDKTNTLTGGYGEVPRIGEGLVQTLNRDRSSTRYLQANLWRAKSAFNDLSGN